LLDVNVLLALAWPNHLSHHAVKTWYRTNRENQFVTCPITESGFVRLSLNPTVVGQSIDCTTALNLLQTWRKSRGWTFIPDTLDIASALKPFPYISGHRQITDAYLLALAVSSDARLLTTDGGIKDWCPPEWKTNIELIEV
jgi:hypothetical protein